MVGGIARVGRIFGERLFGKDLVVESAHFPYKLNKEKAISYPRAQPPNFVANLSPKGAETR